MKLRFYSLFLFFLPVMGMTLSAQSDHLLWYKAPATYFEEALVLGNGKMGATVYGGVTSDRISLNDATLWSGEPVDPDMNPRAHTYIPAIRKALQDEDYRRADSLNHFVQGSFSESYAPLGTMFLEVETNGEATGYRRELDISRAVSSVSYQAGGNRFTREYFVSHPDSVMVIRLTSEKKQALNFTIHFQSLLRYGSSAEGDILKVSGYAPYHNDPKNHGNRVDFDPDRGTRFTVLFRIRHQDGKVTVTDSTLSLGGGSEAMLLVSAATSFNGFSHDPARDGRDDASLAETQLERAFRKPFKSLEKDHIADYRTYFDRVGLELGPTQAPDLPTDERLMRYAGGEEDKNLEILYFQFGRYLLISGSRTRRCSREPAGDMEPLSPASLEQ